MLQSGARINISDGQSIERIVTLTGANECLNKAFAMISYKFEEVSSIPADCSRMIIVSTISGRSMMQRGLSFFCSIDAA